MPHLVHVYKDFYPPVIGGIEKSINWMIRSIRGSGWEVTVLVNSGDRASREREWEGVRVVEIGEWRRFQSAPLSPGFPLALRRLKADVWHFHVPNPTGDFSYLLARPRGRVVATYHSDIVRQAWAMRVYGPFLHAFLRRCEVIMPTSPALLETSPVLQAHAARCRPVPLGMPLEPFARTAETAEQVRAIKRRFKGFPLIVFLGKLRYYKGLQFLLSALRGLPNVQALLIGEGPEGEKLGRLARELGVAERVHFVGELPDAQIPGYLQAADIFCLPSHLPSEAFGLSQVEAMACGVPVVSTRLNTGVPFVNKDGESGLTVPPGDDEALAGALRRLLDDPNLRFKLGEGALRRAHGEFSLEAMGRRLLAVYEGRAAEAPPA